MKRLILILTLFSLISSVSAQLTKVEGFIDSLTKENSFSGTILIEQKLKAVYRKSFGYADLPFKVLNTPDTRYKIASITKAFTAVMILQLYEQGKIDLEKPINTYLTNYKGMGGSSVTVKQLLNMTSGMRNMDDGLTLESALQQGMPQYQKPYTTDKLLAKFCSDTLVNQPGKTFDYNNADYIILGKIIETVSGKTYEQVLSEKIIEPLQLTNSGLLSQEKVIDRLANTIFSVMIQKYLRMTCLCISIIGMLRVLCIQQWMTF